MHRPGDYPRRSTEVAHRRLVMETCEDDLSRIAVSAGFSDHSHMTRTVVAQLGHTPSGLRKLLRHSAARHEIRRCTTTAPGRWPSFGALPSG